ncbi:GspMb/PilO family protein [Pseudoxanthomonas suwonensis]|uniref:GspMb/PilO family protein n=1 Tax=Pseudoxanthomonas suwonensis TaxID=314722 RepID=UPI0012DC61B2|nr:GspMb/PilO family protein [Pseudoxanthomonas suwonensis]
MKPLVTHWQKLRQQAEANPRLKWAFALIAVLLAALLLQAVDGMRDELQKRAIDEEAKLRRIKALQGQDEWLARADEAERLRDALRAEMPETATPGLAQAALQNWLRDLTAGSASRMNVTVDSAVPLEAPADVVKVHATIGGNLAPRQALELLRQIESSTNLVVVETLSMRAAPSANFSIGLNAYYRLPAQEGTP